MRTQRRKGPVVTVRKVTLWRTAVANRPGALAEVLGPLAQAAADLQVVMAYRLAGQERAVIETWPVAGRRPRRAARGAGLAPGGLPTLLVQGAHRAGLGRRIATTLAEAHIDVAFLVAQVVGRRYSAVFGFETAAEAVRARRLLEKLGGP